MGEMRARKASVYLDFNIRPWTRLIRLGRWTLVIWHVAYDIDTVTGAVWRLTFPRNCLFFFCPKISSSAKPLSLFHFTLSFSPVNNIVASVNSNSKVHLKTSKEDRFRKSSESKLFHYIDVNLLKWQSDEDYCHSNRKWYHITWNLFRSAARYITLNIELYTI